MITETTDPEVRGRLELLGQVVDRWAAARGAFYDLGEIPEFDIEPEATPLAELMETDAMYVHFGEEACLGLTRRSNTFLDGMYLNRQAAPDGEDGFLVTFIAAVGGRPEETAEDVGHIASGWIPGDQSIAEGLAVGGLVGDPLLADSKSLFRSAAFFDLAIARIANAKSTVPARLVGRTLI